MIHFIWKFKRWSRAIQLERLEVKFKTLDNKLDERRKFISEYKGTNLIHPSWLDICNAECNFKWTKQLPKLHKKITQHRKEINRIKREINKETP